MFEGRFDDRLLGPGWAGDISDDEVFFIQEELLRDKKLAYQWGFAPSRSTRPADAIRRVALEGDPEHRNANVPLTRLKARPDSGSEPQPETQSEAEPEVPAEDESEDHAEDQDETQLDIQANTPPTMLTLWDYAGIDVPQAPPQSDLTKVGS